MVAKRIARNSDTGKGVPTVCPTCGKPLTDEFGDVTVNYDRFEIHAGDKIVRLTSTEFSLFWMLYRKRGLTVPKEPLLARLVQLRGGRNDLAPKTLEARLSILRKKIAPLRMRIETRWGEGVALMRKA